jgi:hypothetical protein
MTFTVDDEVNNKKKSTRTKHNPRLDLTFSLTTNNSLSHDKGKRRQCSSTIACKQTFHPVGMLFTHLECFLRIVLLLNFIGIGGNAQQRTTKEES